jgi:elongation factor P
MKISGIEIRPGMLIEHRGGLWAAVKIQHTQPGKGGAYMQVELKNVRDGSKLNERFRAAESVENVSLDRKDYQFLFADGDLITLMDTETYEQLTVNRELVGEPAVYLQDGMTVQVQSYEGAPLAVRLPDTVVMVLSETEPTLKGQTAASSYKPGKLENGVRIMVPPFLSSGERIVVNTADSTYVRRAE